MPPTTGVLATLFPLVFALQLDLNLKFTNCIDGAVLRAPLIRLLLAQITPKSDNAHLLVILAMVSYAPRLESPQASRENSPTQHPQLQSPARAAQTAQAPTCPRVLKWHHPPQGIRDDSSNTEYKTRHPTLLAAILSLPGRGDSSSAWFW
ncbi:hypothetical protein BJX65DRAFT_162017 [Aspergillus insuetus]